MLKANAVKWELPYVPIRSDSIKINTLYCILHYFVYHLFMVPIFALTFRHRASCILGQAFHYSPENAFYISNEQIYFII